MKTLSSALPIALTLVILSPTAAGAQVPSAPVIRGSAPASPSSSNTPRIFGGSDAGTTVTLYESADCTGPVEDRGAALGFWFEGLQAQVVDNGDCHLHRHSRGRRLGLRLLGSLPVSGAHHTTYFDADHGRAPEVQQEKAQWHEAPSGQEEVSTARSMKRQRIIVVGTAACLFAGSMVSTAVGGPSISKLVKKEVAKQIAGMTGPRGAGGASGAPGQDAIAPAGAVMFFNLASCPSGWTELTSARGRYLVGRPSGGALAGTQGTALTNLADPSGGTAQPCGHRSGPPAQHGGARRAQQQRDRGDRLGHRPRTHLQLGGPLSYHRNHRQRRRFGFRHQRAVPAAHRLLEDLIPNPGSPMRSKQRLALFTFMTFAAISLVVTASASADRYVDDSGSDLASSLCDDPTDPCLTINKAIGKASPGETIFIGGSVGDGDGDDNYGQASVNKRVSLTEADFFSSSGQTDGQAVIDGGGTNGVLVLASGAGASVEGLTIRGTTSLALYAPATVRGNVFDDPDTHDRIVAAAGSGSYMFTGNTILDDGVGEGPIGILSQSTGSPQIAGNTFRNLQVGIVSNVLTPNTGTPAITDNTISGTRSSAGAGIGVVVSAGTTATLTGNHIHNAVDGVETTVGIFVDQTDARPVGATLRRNRVFDHDIGLRVQRTLGAVTLDGDVIANSTQRALELRETEYPRGRRRERNQCHADAKREPGSRGVARERPAHPSTPASSAPRASRTRGAGSCAITNSNLIPGDTPAGTRILRPGPVRPRHGARFRQSRR